ncbi:hypothetical protein GQ457_HM001880 [Hibiscus cannabinus]
MSKSEDSDSPGWSASFFMPTKEDVARAVAAAAYRCLIVYPPEKQLPLKCKDLLSFCFPGGIEVADNSTLYGCCVLVEEIVPKALGLLSLISDRQPAYPIFDEERLERLTKSIGDIDLELSESYSNEANMDDALTDQGALEDMQNAMTEECDTDVDDFTANKQMAERHLPNAVLPFLRYYQYESSESSCSFQGSPCDDRNLRSDVDDTETEEASISGQEDSSDHLDILEWAKANKHGSLQILCEYYQLRCPARGSKLRFHPLEHLHLLEYHRPDEQVLQIAGSTIDLSSCSTSLEFAEAYSALSAEEEAIALSTWAVACMCGSLRLEHVLTIFAGALLEKQIVVVCSNLGILSALVLSIVPLIRPYQWQSLLMPVLPDDMLDFLDAPVPYIVGVKNKTSEVQSKLANVILVDANKNQIKASTVPQLPQHKELFACLSPYHAKLVGESYLGRKRPVYECTNVQIEAAKGFLSVLRSYVDSLCSNMRSHTITNVQSNNDKVSLLLKESFIESFPSRDRPFMKLFVDTQLFTVHTDLVLSFIQKE